MPYLVSPEQPVLLPWAVFIREPYLIKPHFAAPWVPALKAKKIHPTGEYREFNEFKIHLGRYDVDPEKNARSIKLLGKCVAATLDGELVGAVNSFSLWVHHAFTKQGLATEMIVDRFRYTGLGTGRHYSVSEKPMIYTPEGFAALKAGYLEIVKRGLLDPGPAGVPG